MTASVAGVNLGKLAFRICWLHCSRRARWAHIEAPAAPTAPATPPYAKPFTVPRPLWPFCAAMSLPSSLRELFQEQPSSRSSTWPQFVAFRVLRIGLRGLFTSDS